MNKRYEHYENEIREYISSKKSAGKTSYFLMAVFIVLFEGGMALFTYAISWKPKTILGVFPSTIKTGVSSMPVFNILVFIGLFLVVMSIIPLVFWYLSYTDRYYEYDIQLENPAEFVKDARETAPEFIRMESIEDELLGIDVSVEEIIKTREKLEEIFNVNVDDIKEVKRTKKAKEHNINVDIELTQPLWKLQGKEKPDDVDPKQQIPVPKKQPQPTINKVNKIKRN